MSNYPQDDSRRQRQPQTYPRDPNALKALYERSMMTWRLFWDGRVGITPKLIPIAAIAYLLSPIDLVPELLLGPLAPLGMLDDIGLLILSLNLFIKAAPPDIVWEHLRQLGMSRPEGQVPYADEDIIDGDVEGGSG